MYVYVTFYWPCLHAHAVLHNHVPVDAENILAHLNLVFEEFRYVVAWLQQEHIRRVGQEHLHTWNKSKQTRN